MAKLSSVSTISLASRATSVPLLPIAAPMWADFSAGASFTPSPVTATMCPMSLSALTMRSFCVGLTRAKTRAVRSASRSSSSDIRSSRTPVIASASSPSPRMPIERAIALAVVP
ncbi:MAG: hypothetical protein EA379_07475 [Phycisphaerales bacterium]|nr:MAG: hypothetical protein EA379_07475 [Phycisphaerales bacterium]